MLAIIGGSGLARLSNLEVTRRQVVRTPYGEPSSALTFGNILDHQVIFLARHGYGVTIPPHEINYRANLWSLHAQKARNVIAVATVGGIRADLVPGALAVPDQIIDYTHGRKSTYFNTTDNGVTHIDFTQPYDEPMRQRLFIAAESAREQLLAGGTYAATQGPRLETAAEINRLERDGADMVGMTGMPEAALARELGMRYATIAVVANHAAGRGSSRQGIQLDLIHAVTQQAIERVHHILEKLVMLDGD